MRKKKVLSCCSSAVTEARFQHIVLHIVRYLQFQCAWELSCLAPNSCLAQTKTAFKFQRSLLPSATCHGRTKTGEGCVQWAFLVWKTSSKTTRHRDWMTAVSYFALKLPFQCVCCPWFVSSLHFFPSCTFLEITSWPQWCDTYADCRPYEPVDTNYGGEPGTYGGRQVSWHQLFLKGMGVSKNRGTPKWMVYNGKPY